MVLSHFSDKFRHHISVDRPNTNIIFSHWKIGIRRISTKWILVMLFKLRHQVSIDQLDFGPFSLKYLHLTYDKLDFGLFLPNFDYANFRQTRFSPFFFIFQYHISASYECRHTEFQYFLTQKVTSDEIRSTEFRIFLFKF